ncbi:MAG: NUDIX hydrolase [Ktedonobacterales bacterium]
MTSDDIQPSDEVIYRGSLLTLRVETAPDAQQHQRRYEIVDHPASAAIVALRIDPARADQPLVALVRQHRPAVGRDTWELPAGIVQPDERTDPLLTAGRELREEVGATADQWRLLASEYIAPGFTNALILIYLATGVHLLPAAIPDPDEIAAVEWLPLGEALTRAQAGAATDGKTLIGLTLTRDLLAASRPTATPSSITDAGGTTMPLDPNNAPFQRTTTYTQEARERGAEGGVGTDGLDATLKLDNMLLEEYNYANVTAYQALEDRARMFNLYLLLIGVLGSGLAAVYQLGKGLGAFEQDLVVALLFLTGLMGVAFFIKQIRLRQAYRESLLAMNTVKEYYIREFKQQKANVGDAFHWRLATMPTGEKFGSVTFVVCATIAFLGALCFAGAVFVAEQSWLAPFFSASAPSLLYYLLGAAAVLVVALVIFAISYRVCLSRKQEEAKIGEIASRFGIPWPPEKKRR